MWLPPTGSRKSTPEFASLPGSIAGKELLKLDRYAEFSDTSFVLCVALAMCERRKEEFMRYSNAWLTAAVAVCCLGLITPRAHAQCPAYGADTTCGTVITITASGAQITQTGQGPYDGNDDTLVGIVNNSNVAINSLVITSSLDIFGFDGDGVDTYGAPGNSMDSSGYGGPNTYFTNVNAYQSSGTVNFVTPLAPKGGSTYFSLENALASTSPCSDIVNGSVATPTVSGPAISSTFTPNFGLWCGRGCGALRLRRLRLGANDRTPAPTRPHSLP